MTICAAARRNDPVSHSFVAAATTIALPIAIGGGIVTGVLLAETGPLAVSAGLNAAMFILQAAEWLGSQGRQTTGKIRVGAETVFVGASRERHATVENDVDCTDSSLVPILVAGLTPLMGSQAYGLYNFYDALSDTHEDAIVKTGSDSVFIEMLSAARVGDKISCEAQIEAGEVTVLEGGETVVLEGMEDGTEVPSVVGWTYWAMDWADAFVSLFSAKSALKHLKPDATKFDIVMKKIAVKTAKTGIVLKGTRDVLNASGNKDKSILPDAADKVIKTTELLVNAPKGLRTKRKDTMIKIATQTRKDVTTGSKVVKVIKAQKPK